MKYAQLIRLLVNRELTLRYKRSVIGIGWTLLNPVLTCGLSFHLFSHPAYQAPNSTRPI